MWRGGGLDQTPARRQRGSLWDAGRARGLSGQRNVNLRLNVPGQWRAGGFISSDSLLTVCDDERQLGVGARHRLFS